MSKSVEKRLAVQKGGAVVEEVTHTLAKVPDYIEQGKNRGNEEVTASDMVVPRIEIAQALSPCIKKSDPAYIDNAAAGDLFNSVTRHLYGAAVDIIPVMFRKEYLVWRDRKSGGGFRGAHKSLEEAKAKIDLEDDKKGWEAIETGQHYVLVVGRHDVVEPAVISMARTKLKVSRNFNTLVRLNGGDRYSRMYSVGTVEEQNDKGDFYNFRFINGGYPSLNAYRAAKAFYDQVAGGHVVMDSGDLEGEVVEQEDSEY